MVKKISFLYRPSLYRQPSLYNINTHPHSFTHTFVLPMCIIYIEIFFFSLMVHASVLSGMPWIFLHSMSGVVNKRSAPFSWETALIQVGRCFVQSHVQKYILLLPNNININTVITTTNARNLFCYNFYRVRIKLPL